MTPASNPSSRARALAGVATWGALAVILLLTGLTRWNLLSVPFERDEGLYSYLGQLILAGEIPFVDFYEKKPPLLYYSYAALIWLFGNDLEGVRSGFIAVNSLTIALVFGVGRRLGDRTTGLVAAACFAILSIAAGVQGFSAQSEHLVVLFAMAAFASALWALDADSPALFVAAGVLTALAFLVKQSAIFFGFFLALAIATRSGWRHFLAPPLRRPLLLYALGAALPYALVCGIWLAIGAFGEFWFWTFDYAAYYASGSSAREAWEFLTSEFSRVVGGHQGLWAAAAAGLALALLGPLDPARKRLLGLFVLFSFLTVVPGLRFFRHYWIQALPAVALSLALGLFALRRILAARMSEPASAAVVGTLVVVGLGLHVGNLLPYYLRPDIDEIARTSYGINPFRESLVVARYIEERTSPDDAILVFGSEPQVYFYSQRHCATRHLYFEVLVRDHPLVDTWQREFVREVEESDPKYIVAFMNPISLIGTRSILEELHRDWFMPTVERHYRPVLIGRTNARLETRWIEEPAAIANYQPSGGAQVYVFERSSPGAQDP